MTEYMLKGTMDLPRRFELHFDRPVAVYRAGETVSGRLLVQVDDTMPLRTLFIVLRGEARVEWEEDSGDSRKTIPATTVVSDSKDIISIKRTVIGLRGADITDNEIATGTHEFVFSFTLPAEPLPTSFEGDYGHIRYWVKAVIDRPWMSKPTTKKCFTVLETQHLNPSQLACKFTDKLETNVGSFLCRPAPISLEASTNKHGYCPGEAILLCIECKNYSKHKFLEARGTLVQRVHYYSQDKAKSRMVDNPLLHKKGDPPEPRGVLRWRNEALIIPCVPLTTMCDSLITLTYFLKISLIGMKTEKEPTMQLYLPVIVTDVKCEKSRKASRYSVQSNFSLPGTPDTKEDMIFTRTTDFSHEHFEHSMMGGSDVRDETDDKYTLGDLRFTPLYPYVYAAVD
ncbi:arrestin domain-containing protein 3-like [Ptychodera flava]|uniref:arrestin domain-containing protein 3-like n=1 Tax=Ptychodera flava TaxID=63121 RepID=UPI00396A7495